jgi:hypothetical protein
MLGRKLLVVRRLLSGALGCGYRRDRNRMGPVVSVGCVKTYVQPLMSCCSVYCNVSMEERGHTVKCKTVSLVHPFCEVTHARC